jgi:hypothetical protein
MTWPDVAETLVVGVIIVLLAAIMFGTGKDKK